MNRPRGVLVMALALAVIPAGFLYASVRHLNPAAVVRSQAPSLACVVCLMAVAAGLARLRNWARNAMIVFGAVNLVACVHLGVRARYSLPSVAAILVYGVIWSLVIWYVLQPAIREAFTGSRAPSSPVPRAVLAGFIVTALFPLRVSYEGRFPMYAVGGTEAHAGFHAPSDWGFGIPFPFLIQQYDAFAYTNAPGLLLDAACWLLLYVLLRAVYQQRQGGAGPKRSAPGQVQ